MGWARLPHEAVPRESARSANTLHDIFACLGLSLFLAMRRTCGEVTRHPFLAHAAAVRTRTSARFAAVPTLRMWYFESPWVSDEGEAEEPVTHVIPLGAICYTALFFKNRSLQMQACRAEVSTPPSKPASKSSVQTARGNC